MDPEFRSLCRGLTRFLPGYSRAARVSDSLRIESSDGAFEIRFLEPTTGCLMTEDNRSMIENTSEESAPPIDDNLRAGLTQLFRARTYALDAGADLWEFALEIGILYETPLTISDLRWLVAKGFAEHGQETSFYGDPHRSFRSPAGAFNFLKKGQRAVVLSPPPARRVCGQGVGRISRRPVNGRPDPRPAPWHVRPPPITVPSIPPDARVRLLAGRHPAAHKTRNSIDARSTQFVRTQCVVVRLGLLDQTLSKRVGRYTLTIHTPAVTVTPTKGGRMMPSTA